MTTTKKFKSNPVAKKIKLENIIRSEQAKQALENAAQVKEWSKYDVEETETLFFTFFAGLFLGAVVTMILATTSIIQACN